MATIHSKFISGWEAIFAPSISEGQVISAYVDEPISPYVILGDNFLPASLALKSLFISRSLSNEDISSMSLSLLDYIGPNSLHSVALSINGILLSEGSDFYTHDNSAGIIVLYKISASLKATFSTFL